MDSSASPGPLAGIVVADFSRVLAGPLCTMTLGDLGATVVKVERPVSGDDTRSWGPPWAPDGTSTYYLSINRNKRSIALDMEDPHDRELARSLALRADVLVENFAGGRMERWGLGYADLVAGNPGLVYAAISGFGPDSGLPGYDLLVQAMSGLMSITGEPGRPSKVGVAVVDVLTGLHATIGILAALHDRDRSGRGQRVEVSLMQSALSALVNQASAALVAGVTPQAMGNRHPSIAPYEVFEAADRSFVVAVGTDAQFTALCEVVGLPDLSGDPAFATNAARVADRDRLHATLDAVFRSRPASGWVEALRARGLPAGPILDIPSAIAEAASQGLAPAVAIDGTPSMRSPIGLDRTPPTYRTPPPALDADRAALRAWLEEGADGSPP